MLNFQERLLAALCIMCFMGIGALLGRVFGYTNLGTIIGIVVGVLVAIYLALLQSGDQTKKHEAILPDTRRISRRKRKRKQRSR